MSDRKKDICARSGRLNRRTGRREDLDDTLPDWKEAKKIYDEIKIPEELDRRVRDEITKRRKQ
ncbi:MAG: hypothetical protein ACI4D3_15015 [Lachnospiraceae bacterium]